MHKDETDSIVWILSLFAAVFSITESLALRISTTQCPSYEEVGAKEVDLEQYQGTWYGLLRNDDGGLGCPVYTESIFTNESGTFRKQENHIRQLQGPTREIKTIFPAPESKKEPGYSHKDKSSVITYYYLDTDYENHSIRLGCVKSYEFARSGLFLYTRKPEVPDKDTLQKFRDYHTKFGLDPTAVDKYEPLAKICFSCTGNS